MKRILSAGFAVLMLLSLLLTCALAEGANSVVSDATAIEKELLITNVTQDSTSHGLHIELESALPNAEKKENYSVMLGGNRLEILNLTQVEGATEATPAPTASAPQQSAGTSWFFLTDVSSISTNRGEEKLRDTLKSLLTLVTYSDNWAMLTTANSTPVIMPSSQMPNGEITAEYNQNATNLYSAIANTLDYISNNQTLLKPNKSLVILSKGDDKKVTDTSVQQTVLQKIAATDVTVYTISFSNSPSYNFTALAQQSQNNGHGGLSIDYNNTNGNIYDNAVRMIQNSEVVKRQASGGGAIVTPRKKFTLDTSAPQEEGVGSTVQVTFKDGETEKNAEYALTSNIVYPQKGFFKRFIEGLKAGDLAAVAIVAVAVVVLVLIGALLFMKLRKNRQGPVNFNQGETVIPPTAAVSTAVPGGTTISDTSAVTSMGEVTRANRLQLTLRESNGKTHRAMMSSSGITAGRQGDNHIVLDSNDKHISRHHFVLKQQGEEVVLEGISETNGTYVNGMRISGPIALRQRDVVRVGNTELTVTWKYE